VRGCCVFLFCVLRLCWDGAGSFCRALSAPPPPTSQLCSETPCGGATWELAAKGSMQSMGTKLTGVSPPINPHHPPTPPYTIYIKFKDNLTCL
jgi:hypothetical protein